MITRKDSLGRHCRHCGAFVSVRTAQACSHLLIVEPDIVSQCDISNPYFTTDAKLKPPKRWFEFCGRGERIRTFDTLVPNQVLYQTELRPENEHYYKLFFIKSNWILQNLQKRDYCLTMSSS